MERSSLERYMAGEPLTPELAALRDGQQVQLSGDGVRPAAPVVENADRELTRAERAHLRELRLAPGWPVLQRLEEKIFQMHQKGAITTSQSDPLRNGESISQEWAYVTMIRRAFGELELLMQAEIKHDDEGKRQ
jgi:hypothetical protein